MSRFFLAPDGNGDETIWLNRGHLDPIPVIRNTAIARIYWPIVVEAFTNGDTA